MELGKYIHELLYRYDCVIIPGFGGFVGNYTAARINPAQHRFYPPGKRLTFNKHLTNNDGLLANLIAQKETCSFETAMLSINAEVKRIQIQLHHQGKFELPHIGKFHVDNELNLIFEPHQPSNYLLEAYGLTTFQVLPLQESSNIATDPASDDQTPVIPLIRKKELLKIAKVAAAASVFFALLWIPLKTDLMQQAGIKWDWKKMMQTEAPSYSVHNPSIAVDNVTNAPSLPNTTATFEWSFLDENERLSSTPKKIKIYTPSEKKEVVIKNEAVVVNGPFHIVGGCFSVEKNAEKLVRKLRKKGYSASIPGKRNDLSIVAYGSFQKRSDAVAFLNKIKETENKQAWLLKK